MKPTWDNFFLASYKDERGDGHGTNDDAGFNGPTTQAVFVVITGGRPPVGRDYVSPGVEIHLATERRDGFTGWGWFSPVVPIKRRTKLQTFLNRLKWWS